jgi:alkanesulfonate monooxygenase SsuD/methylene tetrahydromethanopterin reductase-like flavin-dependent oxidoreductase (luciferase family)
LGRLGLPNGGPEDCIPILAAIATRCGRLKLGTSVVQTYPRHPVVLATEANVIDQLAPGRLRIGVGPSHGAIMEMLGIDRRAPFEHLREYVTVLRMLAEGGPVDFEGEHYRVRSTLGRRLAVPIMVDALQPKTFELAGGESDGAITWFCPPSYLATVAMPALEQGAAAAGRKRPLLVAHLAACVHDDGSEAREAVRVGIPNIRFPAYQRMLVRAGLANAIHGEWTDALVDRVIAWGSVERVSDRINEMFDLGADEVLIRPIGAGTASEKVAHHTVASIAAQF